jgi:glycine betaine catabolism B
MMKLFDRVLNGVTMYRVTLYYLAGLLGLGLILSVFGVVPEGPVAVVSTTAILLAVCVLANAAFARLWRTSGGAESSIITALILALILGPVSPFKDPAGAGVIALAGLVAIASKYLLALRRQHLFNPAAVGALVSGMVFGTFATWWVGSLPMLPLVALGGFLVVRKVSRLRLVGIYLGLFLVFNVALAVVNGLPSDMAVQSLLFVLGQTSALFFTAVMFTEPMTSPKRLGLQVIYAALVAFLYQPQLAVLGRNLTPEQALLVGNLFSYLVSPSFKLRLVLKEKKLLAPGLLAFAFPRPPGMTHRLGQYMEWSLPLAHGDSRGARRYLSLASSPTEDEILVAARFPEKPSAFKAALAALPAGGIVTAGELAGDFVLPRDSARPLAFIAGGIGITPFRSMIKYLHDRKERRDVVLIYSNYGADEIVFRDVFDAARDSIGLKVIYTLTDTNRVPAGWTGRTGFVDAAMLKADVPDIGSRQVFVSGSQGMVDTMKKVLSQAGVKRSAIRTDFFPGYSS